MVILHHERWPGVLGTVRSAVAQAPAGAPVVVVDNASPSFDDHKAASLPAGVILLKLEINDGYGAGMNRGMELLRQLGCDTAVLLTHEVIFEPDAVGRLLEALEDERTGLVGPMLVTGEGPEPVVWSAGGTKGGRSWHLWHLDAGVGLESWHGEAVTEVDWLDGAVLAGRLDVLEELGRFDDRYFLYFEDADLAFRARRRGYSVRCVRSAVAHADAGGHITPRLWQRNRLRFLTRAAPPALVGWALLRDQREVVFMLLDGRQRAVARERQRGLVDFVLGRAGRVQGSRRITSGP